MSGFGSHGGDGHYVVTNASEVERLLERDVAERDRELWRHELDNAAPYERIPSLRARIKLAMLYLADGDFTRLQEARALADSDWRDLLVAAEYSSTPASGTTESRVDRTARQERDRRAIESWRNRPEPPAGTE